MTTQHHTQPALPAQPTLQERRAHLRELMKHDDATVEDYHTVISGATEEERASLARTLSPTKLAKARGGESSFGRICSRSFNLVGSACGEAYK